MIEIVSKSTEHVDRGPEMDLYARVWRARAYVPTRAERVEAERDRAVVERVEAEARLRELEQELARLGRGS